MLSPSSVAHVPIPALRSCTSLPPLRAIWLLHLRPVTAYSIGVALGHASMLCCRLAVAHVSILALRGCTSLQPLRAIRLLYLRPVAVCSIGVALGHASMLCCRPHIDPRVAQLHLVAAAPRAIRLLYLRSIAVLNRCGARARFYAVLSPSCRPRTIIALRSCTSLQPLRAIRPLYFRSVAVLNRCGARARFYAVLSPS